ncbi:phosphomannomutase/phosphoglucomutase [Derxia gummosa]|uniref:Phosphomannomutase/phosphoglucomutase n=1 Tax=Derxia gummosa DSM 723 TaxID=1121388 RepID=A0A8B6X1R3_9BURK|nr:phosphomannomutase/phosphoglucomutase [Derxia gummosa]
MTVPADIFRPSSIRGLVRQTLTPQIAEQIGLAIGSEALARGRKKIAVGRDGRLLSADYASAVACGINDAGVDVIDIGLCATPVLQFAAHEVAGGSAVMVTGGRSNAQWDGMRVMLGGVPLCGDAIAALHRRIEAKDFAKGSGDYERDSFDEAYIEKVVAGIRLARPVKLALDCGNGATGAIAEELFKRIGCTVSTIWPQVDGNFPNHFPDPTVRDNLIDLVATQRSSQQGEVGIAFNCDGSGLGLVDTRGYAVDGDRVLMLLAADLAAGGVMPTVVADVKSSPRLAGWLAERGGSVAYAPSGHGFIEAAMAASGAVLGGEFGGHYFFRDRWHGHDDALYAAARIAEALSRTPDGAAAIAALPKAVTAQEVRIKVGEGEAAPFVAEVAGKAVFDGAPEVETTDGLRVVWPDGFGVLRASGTGPALTLRFEGANDAAYKRVQAAFRAAFQAVRPGVALPF